MKTDKPLHAPAWLLRQVRQAKGKMKPEVYVATSGLMIEQHLNTVCESACCPNRGKCYSRGTATLMIMGNICTRKCRFCAVEHGRPAALDFGESERVASTIASLKLDHVVITSVTRDDLEDGGAGHFTRVVEAVKKVNPETCVEVLVPDFRGNPTALDTVLEAGPEVLGHNMETVSRLYQEVRPGASYERSLQFLHQASRSSNENMKVKSGLMLGLGERGVEVRTLLHDLYDAGCTMVTIGQYLAPTLGHYPVQRYISPDEFSYWEKEAVQIGFQAVASAPLVRSSFDAGPLYQEALRHGS